MVCDIDWIDDNHLKISGEIDEFSDFVNIFDKFPKEIWVDLKEVSRINSLGIRQWLEAMRGCQSHVHLMNCSESIIDAINLVPQFLGEHGRVESFEVTFICDECSTEVHKFLDTKDIQFEDGEVQDFESQETCLSCGGDMDLNHVAEIYFDFLLKAKF